MNKLVNAIKALDLDAIKELFAKDLKLIEWKEKDGKSALHHLCGLRIGDNEYKTEQALQILKFLLKSGMDINSIHQIPETGGHFPATPVWYAYTRGCNERLYKYLLKQGANPDNCMFAIAWYDDAKAAATFVKHGASIKDNYGKDNPFLAAIGWKKFKVAEWFLKNGADVNFADDKGNTALHIALKRDFEPAAIRMLLKYGADPDRKNNEGVSSKSMLRPKKHKDIAELFEK